MRQILGVQGVICRPGRPFPHRDQENSPGGLVVFWGGILLAFSCVAAGGVGRVSRSLRRDCAGTPVGRGAYS